MKGRSEILKWKGMVWEDRIKKGKIDGNGMMKRNGEIGKDWRVIVCELIERWGDWIDRVMDIEGERGKSIRMEENERGKEICLELKSWRKKIEDLGKIEIEGWWIIDKKIEEDLDDRGKIVEDIKIDVVKNREKRIEEEREGLGDLKGEGNEVLVDMERKGLKRRIKILGDVVKRMGERIKIWKKREEKVGKGVLKIGKESVEIDKNGMGRDEKKIWNEGGEIVKRMSKIKGDSERMLVKSWDEGIEKIGKRLEGGGDEI